MQTLGNVDFIYVYIYIYYIYTVYVVELDTKIRNKRNRLSDTFRSL